MGKPTICIGENKGADQLRGNREADQRLCFRYSDSTIPPLLASVAVQVGLCQTCSETTLLVFPRCGSIAHWILSVLRNSMLRKLAHAIYRDFLTVIIENAIGKNDFFNILALNIYCGYTLGPPRRSGSNEYPQSMFWIKNKNNR